MCNRVIMLVEDETEIREGIRILLYGEEYTILEASNGEDALAMMNEAVDLVILDIMLPGMSGIRVCEELRKISSVPVIFLTAKAMDADKVIALTAGGDDYLTKPFSYTELLARIKAQLRRCYVYKGKSQKPVSDKERIIISGRFKVSLMTNEVWKDGEPIDLTEKEHGIFSLLIKNPMRVFSAQNIYEFVWNEPYTYSTNDTLMVHIRKLRRKIEDEPQKPKYIKNIWGEGYRFEP